MEGQLASLLDTAHCLDPTPTLFIKPPALPGLPTIFQCSNPHLLLQESFTSFCRFKYYEPPSTSLNHLFPRFNTLQPPCSLLTSHSSYRRSLVQIFVNVDPASQNNHNSRPTAAPSPPRCLCPSTRVPDSGAPRPAPWIPIGGSQSVPNGLTMGKP